MQPLGLTLTMTLTLNFKGQIWNLLYISQKCSDYHETKSKHIDWTQGLKCDHGVWPWIWHGICYISAKNGPIATKRKANISIELKASNVTMGFDLGHDLDLEFSRSNMEFAISQSKVIRRSGARIYKIVTGVTSDVGVPSTHLVIWEVLWHSPEGNFAGNTQDNLLHWILDWKILVDDYSGISRMINYIESRHSHVVDSMF